MKNMIEVLIKDIENVINSAMSDKKISDEECAIIVNELNNQKEALKKMLELIK